MVADGPIVATFHTANPRSRWLNALPGGPAAVHGEDHRPDRGQRTGQAGAGRAPRRRRGDHPQRGRRAVLRDGRPRCRAIRSAGGTIGFVGRFDESRKGMAVLLDALRLMVPTRPDLQLLVAGSGDEKDLREPAGPELAGALRIPRPGVGRRQGLDAAVAGHLLRPEHRRRELRDHPDRGDERRDAGGGQRPRRVPPGAGRRHRRRADAGRRRTGAGRGACRRCWTTPAGGPCCPRRAAGWSPPTTGRSSPRRWSRSTKRWSPPIPRAVVEAD